MAVHRLLDGALLAPGLIDVQVNGGGDVLFNDEPTIPGVRKIAAAHRRFGTTGLLPTLISDTGSTMVRFDGEFVGGSPPHVMARKGVAIVLEGRRLFTGMSVEDNLRVAIDHAQKVVGGQTWTLDRLYQLFPILSDKKAARVETLSGGQQQMVAIGRALLSQPRVLLCDEISLGLSPRVVREIYAVLPSISETGAAVVLVEQDVALAQRASDRIYCMLEGRITLTGNSAGIERSAIARAYFGADHAVG
jgi:branched-chain amino acid transport system ATP-binding protein